MNDAFEPERGDLRCKRRAEWAVAYEKRVEIRNFATSG